TPFWEDDEDVETIRASDNLLYQIDNSSTCEVDGTHNYNYSESACPEAQKPLFVDPHVDRSASPPLLGDFNQLDASPASGYGRPNVAEDNGSAASSGCTTSEPTSWLFGFLLLTLSVRALRVIGDTYEFRDSTEI
ncbi:MAG: hypothetical protein V1798_02895, partial [Pseudomonadota bacterium]